ncbi:ATP-dependent helicase [Neptuniibacter sp. QD37_11]|uniref:ATP-dependent helicase n=1 Tax=Neptuniibacter sp. QD37_11 TaxID=3398209 RepID=UPI0039F4CA53
MTAVWNIKDPELLFELMEMHESLNESQKEAAMSVEGPVLITAGAGSGKTKTIIHRTATLLKLGIPATQILLVTFTNEAAREIKNRLLQMPGIGLDAEYITAGTFHSVIFTHILKKYTDAKFWEMRGLDPFQLEIIDEEDSKKLLKMVIDDLPKNEKKVLDDAKVKQGDIEEILTMERAKGHGYSDYQSRLNPNDKKYMGMALIGKIWQEYEAMCRAANGVDFDNIILFADKILELEPYLAKDLAETFKYLMLDEYQDTNKVQMSVMDRIIAFHQNVCAVGDEKQLIYSWRGSDIQTFLSFTQRYPQAQTIKLADNYRSSPEVLTWGNAIASCMQQRVNDGQLVCNKESSNKPPFCIGFKDQDQEAMMIAKAIKRDIRSGTPAGSVAVLYRARKYKDKLEKALLSLDTPYRIVNDKGLYGRREVKDMIKMMRFIAHPWDGTAGLAVLKSTNFGISEKRAKDSMSQGKAVYNFLLEQSEQYKKAKPGQTPERKEFAKKCKVFVDLCTLLKEGASKPNPDTDFLERSLSRFWDIFFKPQIVNQFTKKDENGNVEIDDYQIDMRVENAAYIRDRFIKDLKAGLPLDEAIMNLALIADMAKEQEAVQLMTLHAAKGREFPHVYIIGCDKESMYPSDPDDINELEEGRRLFYVGVTRAEEKVMCSFAQDVQINGQWTDTEVSPYIREMEGKLGNVVKIYNENTNTLTAEHQI